MDAGVADILYDMECKEKRDLNKVPAPLRPISYKLVDSVRDFCLYM